MTRWFFPCSSGDFRLEPDPDDTGATVLFTADPTAYERELLASFLALASEREWVSPEAKIPEKGESRLQIAASMQEAGWLLVSELLPKEGSLTAVRSVGGKVVADLSPNAPEVTPEVTEVVTVKKPTHCCPFNQPGPIDKRANEVLVAFSTARQVSDWTEHGFLRCLGGTTGHVYRIHHRHHPDAVKIGKIILDEDDQHQLHCWDWSVPPAEEVLAMKLYLEHREEVIRNPSALISTDVLRTPIGSNALSGTDSAKIMSVIGGGFMGGFLGSLFD